MPKWWNWQTQRLINYSFIINIINEELIWQLNYVNMDVVKKPNFN